MSAIAFDTHTFVKRLIEAGMPETQAEVVARQKADLIEDRLATKDDLERLELRMKSEIESSKSDMIKWVAGLLLAQAALIAALVKLL